MAAKVSVAVSQYSSKTADEAYSLLCNWEDHGRWVPMTRVVEHSKDSFTAYTGVGALALEDNMRVTLRDDAARTVRIEKTGPYLKGTAVFSVKPFSSTTSVVTWEEHLTVPFVPNFMSPVLSVVTRKLFSRALRNL